MNEVKLYINNQEIEFSSTPDILFTYQEDDLTNPTVVKNSYTKSITVPGTKQNNTIFNGIWNVERIQSEENFNVTKRVPFSLYINGDIYQTGYAKLDKISRSQNKIVYSITLYGGLGQFLYNLSIDWNTGDKKTLANMDYFDSSYSTTPVDLGFTINKDTVASAWTSINSNDKWGMVNFAPTYIGHPDKISCDKVLINFSGSPITSAVTSGDTAYTPTGGYGLGTLPQALSSEEVRDYRSYIQTPVIRVKSIFDAICRKENNAGRYDNGYDVELDSDFFSSTNPYYWDSWVTLPTITNLEFSSEGGGGETTAYTANPISSEWDINGNCLYTFTLSEPVTAGSLSVKATIALGVTGNSSSDNLYFYYTRLKGRGSRVYYRNAYGIQFYASNSVSSSENVLAGSNVKWLSGDQKYTYGDAVASGQFTPKWNTNVVENHTGYFTKVSGSTFQYTGETGNLLELNCDLPVGTSCFKLFIKRCNSSNNSERNMLFTSTSPNSGEKIQVTPLPFYSRDIVLSSIDSGESISNRYISKEMLLSTSYSPCDWLLSYCKKFGLYLKKDVVEDKVYIMTRNNYYKRDEVIDIDKDIDYSKSFDINPVYCQNGYLSLTDEGVESKSYADYTQKTGKVYGQKIVNTGYEFNADTKELNNGIFKGSIQAKDVSQYLNKRSSLGLLPYVYNIFKYVLYANGDYTGATYEITYPQGEIVDICEPFDENFPNYDLIGKPMFTDDDGKSLDTENVLLFFNGYENVSAYKWYLTDDHSYMYKLNNNPTWLMTFGEYDMFGVKIANQIINFPRFSRWYEGNNLIIYSFDYGSPRYLYVPEFVNNDEANIYYNYYKKYYEDLYDVDTKVVDCYALGKFDEESLRKFYWFKNTIWRLNKVTDYNPTKHDTTKVQFVKVQNLDDMTNEDVSGDLSLTVVLNQYYLPISGGTLIGTVTTSDNYGWTIENYSIYPTGDTAYTVTIDPQSWGSSGNFYLTGTSNNGQDKVVTINVTAGDVGGSVSYLQAGNISSFFCPTDVIRYSKSGGEKNVELTNPYGVPWKVVAKPNWIQVTPNDENTGATLEIRAVYNDTDSIRSGSVVVWDIAHDQTYVIPVQQTVEGAYLNLSPSYIIFTPSGGTGFINVSSNVNWYTEGYGNFGLIFNFNSEPVVSWSGGTVNSANTDFSLFYYDGYGHYRDVKTASTISGSLAVQSSSSLVQHSAGTLTFVATYSGITESASTTVYQEASPDITGITISNVNWLIDIPASGGSATTQNISFTVLGNATDGNQYDVTNINQYESAEGYFIEYYVRNNYVSASTITTRHSAGTMTFSAELFKWVDPSDISYTATTEVVMYQEGTNVEPTGITLNNLAWVTNIPSNGGVADSGNCSFDVLLNNSDGTSEDITSSATISGSETVTASTITSAHTAGTLTLTASYSGFTDSDSIAIIQDAYTPVPPTPTGETEYLTFTILSAGTINWLKTDKYSTPVTIQYSVNNGNWISITNTTAGTSFNVSVGDSVRFKSNWGDNYYTNMSFSGSTAYFNLSGNILSLFYEDNFDVQTVPTEYNLAGIFQSTNVIDAGGLVLPNTVRNFCYDSMFFNCTSLTTAPELPATTLAVFCYQSMFRDCTSLNYIKCLATDISASSCTNNWVVGVAASGTFVKYPNMSSWSIGTSGIPSNWTIINN